MRLCCGLVAALLIGCSSAPPSPKAGPNLAASPPTTTSPPPEVPQGPCIGGDLLECASVIAEARLENGHSGWLALSTAWSRAGELDRASAILMDHLDRSAATRAAVTMVVEGLKRGVKREELLAKVDAKIEQLVSVPYELRSALTLGGLLAARSYVQPFLRRNLPRGTWSDFDFEMANTVIHRGGTTYYFQLLSAEGYRLQGNDKEASRTLNGAFGFWSLKAGLDRSLALRRVAAGYAAIGRDDMVRKVCKAAERPYDCAPMILSMAEAHRKQPEEAQKLVAEATGLLLGEPKGGDAVALTEATRLAVEFGDVDLADKLLHSTCYGADDPRNLAWLSCMPQAPAAKRTEWMSKARRLADAKETEEYRVRERLLVAEGCGDGGDEARGIQLALAERERVGTGRNRERLVAMLADWGAVAGLGVLKELEGDLRERALERYARARAARGDILGALNVAAEAKTAGTLVSALAAAGETQRRTKRDLTDEEKGALGRIAR